MKKHSIPHHKAPLSPFRKLIIDGLYVGQQKHYIKAFVEFDVTRARQSIRQYRRDNKKKLSFTAFFLLCVAKALQNNKSLNAGLKRNNIIVFDDIDISVAVEMDLDGEKVPRLIVIRKAHEKSVQTIHDEIETARTSNKEQGDIIQGDDKNVKLVMLLMKLPAVLRRLIWNVYLKDPFFTKRMMGTAGVTAVGMFGSLNGWPDPIPTSNHAFSCALGSITKKPRVVGGTIEIREILHATLLFDHDIIDGAPAARFTQELTRCVEGGLAKTFNSKD